MRPFNAISLVLLGLTLCWLLLTNASLASLLVGLPVVALAALVWRYLTPSRAVATAPGEACPQHQSKSGPRLSLRGLIAFSGYFLKHLTLGGLAVALQILRPKPEPQPGFIWYHSHIECRHARLFFLYAINLLPGTLVVRQQQARLEVHVLSAAPDAIKELAELERLIARLFPGCAPSLYGAPASSPNKPTTTAKEAL